MSTGFSDLSAEGGEVSVRLPDCFAQHPMRSPSWKWERAVGIVNGTQPPSSRRLDGEKETVWIRRAVRLYRILRTANTQMLAARVSEQYPELYWAYDIYNTAGDVKSHIEAMVLARVSAVEIAQRARMSVAIIQAYESLFFDVRPFLNSELYILHKVLGYTQTVNPERDYGLLWRAYAYYAGPHVLDLLVRRFGPNSWCESPDELNAAIQDDMITTIKLKSSLAAKTVPINRYTQVQLLNAFIQFVEVERNSESKETSLGLLMSGIEQVYRGMRVNINGRDPQNKYTPIDTGVAGIYDTGGVELRADELLDASVGVFPNIGSAKFPAPGEDQSQ